MCRAHPSFDGAKRVLDRLPTNAHFLWRLVEARLHGVDHGLMLPALDPPFLASRALSLDGAGGTGSRPVNSQSHAVLHAVEPLGQTLSSRASINIVFGQINKVLFAESP